MANENNKSVPGLVYRRSRTAGENLVIEHVCYGFDFRGREPKPPGLVKMADEIDKLLIKQHADGYNLGNRAGEDRMRDKLGPTIAGLGGEITKQTKLVAASEYQLSVWRGICAVLAIVLFATLTASMIF